MRILCAACSVVMLSFAATAAAQSTTGVAPLVIPVTGELKAPTGEPRAGTVLLVVSLYDGRDDPAPRWIEYQTVTLDVVGRYHVEFGSTLESGLPAELFTTSTGVRWLGVGVENEPEQPRMMLVSVAYAAKAAVADTLAGKSAGDFVLASTLTDQVKAALRQGEAESRDAVLNAVTLNMLQKGDGGGGTTDSTVIEVGGKVGIGTSLPSSPLSINVSSASTTALGTFDNLPVLLQNTSSTNSNWNLVGFRDAGGNFSAYLGAQTITQANGAADFVLASNPGSGAAERLRILANGNVGIGTTNPTAKLHVAGNVTVDGNIGAKYQDVAEWVDSAEPLEVATLVVIDSLATNRVTAAERPYDHRVAGAVSSQPGVVLGEPGAGRVLIAQSGRVRVKADATHGAIRPGDLLVSSPTRGHVMRSSPIKINGQLIHRPGTVVGKALQALPGGRGEILVLLTLQ